MPENPLQVIQNHDPELFQFVNQSRAFELEGGVLPRKTKLLIAIALDASVGSDGGVRHLAQQALAAGATPAEILDAVRVAHFICGVGSVYTAARGLNDVLK
jgi:alkylhydroperoxidase/carboxymuconolactone decarboxylase family protein YurZ